MDSVFVNLHPDHGLMGCYRNTESGGNLGIGSWWNHLSSPLTRLKCGFERISSIPGIDIRGVLV